MKIAVISDIHGNIDALESVLSDIKKENCTKIFCLGDIVMAGPAPKETIQKIKSLMESKDFYIIQGNTDKMLSEFSFDTYNNLVEKNAVMASAYLADSKLLNDEEKNFLASLTPSITLYEANISMLLVHGSPRKNDENIYPDMKIEEVEEIIKDTQENVIFCGHTHMPCGYQTNTNQTVVNAGSVGRPFTNSPKACYVIMNITDSGFKIEHKFIEYDVEKACTRLKERNFEGADKLAKMLQKAVSRYPV
ncbi:MAG: metallophosphatase family protein [Candidatus Gastranaerophilales bacterium]|nr:metallophosphatase family protein [Candidatus Gastranaerophilales bacterium]